MADKKAPGDPAGDENGDAAPEEPPPPPPPPCVIIDTSSLSNVNKFVYAAGAGILATALVHPLDVWKFNRQISIQELGPKRNVLQRLYLDKGWKSFMPGLSANLISQGTYVLASLAVYRAFTKDLDSKYSENPTFNDEARYQLYANCAGAFCSTPAELALVQCAVDRQLPPRFRKYYSSGLNAMGRTFNMGGITPSFRGGATTVLRTGLATTCSFFIYNQVKEDLSKEYEDNETANTAVSLLVSSLCTSLITLPVDVLKTRYQTMRACGGRPEFCGLIPLVNNLVKCGYSNLFRGLLPYTLRIGLFNLGMVSLFNLLIKLTKEEEPPPPPPPPPPEPAEP